MLAIEQSITSGLVRIFLAILTAIFHVVITKSYGISKIIFHELINFIEIIDHPHVFHVPQNERNIEKFFSSEWIKIGEKIIKKGDLHAA